MVFQDILSPQRQAHIYASGLLAIIFLGSIGLIVACFVVLWLAFQFVALLLASVVECSIAISHLFSSAAPLLEFLILCTLGLLAVKAVYKVWRA